MVIPTGLRNAKHCSVQRPLSSFQMLSHFLSLSVYVALADTKTTLVVFVLSEPFRVRFPLLFFLHKKSTLMGAFLFGIVSEV